MYPWMIILFIMRGSVEINSRRKRYIRLSLGAGLTNGVAKCIIYNRIHNAFLLNYPTLIQCPLKKLIYPQGCVRPCLKNHCYTIYQEDIKWWQRFNKSHEKVIKKGISNIIVSDISTLMCKQWTINKSNNIRWYIEPHTEHHSLVNDMRWWKTSVFQINRNIWRKTG